MYGTPANCAEHAAVCRENVDETSEFKDFEISVAPMVGVSTPEYRRFMRIVSPSSLVFTEMVVNTSLIYMSSSVLERKIGLPSERCVLQVGGCDPALTSLAVKRALALGYKNFNLNCGCPSNRVQNRMFGALLMKDPSLIANILKTVFAETGVVMSVKCRVGVDEIDDYASFKRMIQLIVDTSPCRTFYIHARKCLLKGLSPADNRRVPPLMYDYVFQLKREMPALRIILNGGLRDVQEILCLRGKVDGVMLGRKPMEDPMFFALLEACLFNRPALTVLSAIAAYLKNLEVRFLERALFMHMDTLAPCINSTPNKPRSHDPNLLSNIRMVSLHEIEYLCRYVDLKPIEAVLNGKKGCKEYKREIARLARERLPTSSVIPCIYKYFAVLNVVDAF